MANGISQGFVVGPTSTALLPANTGRRHIIVQNQGPSNVYIAFGSANAASPGSAVAPPNGFLVMGNNGYVEFPSGGGNFLNPAVGITQDVAAITVSGNATLVVLED